MYRPATPEDAPAMTQLANFAGEGMPLYVWTQLAGAGGSPWETGRERAIREEGAFSYRNTVVREESGTVVAALIGYALPDEPEPANYDEMPAMFVPLQQLEDLVPGTWYINVLAAHAEHRGKGYGSGLLAEAERLAAREGCHGLSLIVSDANDGARRLYTRHGYRELATRPMVKEDWKNAGENWILLCKELRTVSNERA